MTEPDPSNPNALTAEHVAALRAADDSVSFYFYLGSDAESACLARKKPRPEPGYDTSKAEAIVANIPLDAPVFTIYKADQSPERDLPTVCYAGVSSPKYTAEWQTVVGLLRKGDVLVPEWRSGNYASMFEKGLALDEFILRVRRGEKVLSFYIDNQVAPLGSPSRMIRS